MKNIIKVISLIVLITVQSAVAAPEPTSSSKWMELFDRSLWWTTYNSVSNLVDLYSLPQSKASIHVSNQLDHGVVLQIAGRYIGLRNSLMILPPGESVTLRDYGLGKTTEARAILIAEGGKQVGYIKAQIIWPTSDTEYAKQPSWDLRKEKIVAFASDLDPLKLPMMLLPKKQQ